MHITGRGWGKEFFHLAEGGKNFFHAVEGGVKDFFVPPKVIPNIFISNTNKQSKWKLKVAIYISRDWYIHLENCWLESLQYKHEEAGGGG